MKPQFVESQMNSLKQELFEKIKEVLAKLRVVKNQNTYEKHYSLALNYVIKQDQESRKRYSRINQNNNLEDNHGQYIDTNMNSERDFNNQNLTEDDYTETYPVTMASGARGSPSRDSYLHSQYGALQHQNQQEGESQYYDEEAF